MILEPLDCLCGADILIGYAGSAESQQTIGGRGAVAGEMTIGFARLVDFRIHRRKVEAAIAWPLKVLLLGADVVNQAMVFIGD